MTFTILFIAALAIAAVTLTTRLVVRDGYAPVPTRYSR